MSHRKPRYPLAEFRRRGEEIFERKTRSLVINCDRNDFVAIDIESEEFEVDTDERAATDRLFARLPAAQPWVRRVGSTVAHWFGATRPTASRKIEFTAKL